jgi:hypothetical protein
MRGNFDDVPHLLIIALVLNDYIFASLLPVFLGNIVLSFATVIFFCHVILLIISFKT